MIVFGTRPEAIKLCPLVLELRKRPRKFKTIVCVTAQHREMLDQVLALFGVVPDVDLNLMTRNQSLNDIMTSCLSEITKTIKKEKPHLVIVQGDTTTTFAAAFAAFYNKVAIGHVEAGLRTNCKYLPFPEEVNRKLTSAIADIHFAPTQKTKMNLLHEGISQKNIFITGNTVIDALLFIKRKITHEHRTYKELKEINFKKKIILVTGHRRENFGSGFNNICHALRQIAKRNSTIEIVYPVHLNPNVRKPVRNILSGIKNIKLLEPLDYEAFIYLMDKSFFIISDSGGIQEEAPSLGKPVLVTRTSTERFEAIESGTVKLVGTNKKKIIAEAQKLIDNRSYFKKMSIIKNPYGNGDACKKIIKVIEKWIT